MKDFRDLLNAFYENNVELGIFTSKNENDEDIIIEITNDYLKTSTIQQNSWIRVNIYYKDRTIEEIYEK